MIFRFIINKINLKLSKIVFFFYYIFLFFLIFFFDYSNIIEFFRFNFISFLLNFFYYFDCIFYFYDQFFYNCFDQFYDFLQKFPLRVERFFISFKYFKYRNLLFPFGGISLTPVFILSLTLLLFITVIYLFFYIFFIFDTTFDLYNEVNDPDYEDWYWINVDGFVNNGLKFDNRKLILYQPTAYHVMYEDEFVNEEDWLDISSRFNYEPILNLTEFIDFSVLNPIIRFIDLFLPNWFKNFLKFYNTYQIIYDFVFALLYVPCFIFVIIKKILKF